MGVHHLQIVFSQIGLYEIAMQYNPFIHNYEYDIYKQGRLYNEIVKRTSKRRKRHAKVSTESLQKSGKLFVSLIAPPGIDNPEWRPIRKFICNDVHAKENII